MKLEIETTHAHDETNAGNALVLRHEISDEQMEASARESAFSYTYQTSAYNRCCR